MIVYIIRKYSRLLILLVVLAGISGAVWWASSQSRITINFSDSTPATLELVGESQSFTRTQEVENGQTLSLPKGSYTLFIQNKEGSFYQVFDVGGFFQKTIINATLKSSNDFSFVGNSPKSCGFMADIYISYSCGGSTDTIQAHLPATDLSPSYTLTDPKIKGLGDIGNVFVINGKNYTIVQQANQKIVGRNALYEVVINSKSVTLKLVRELSSLSSNEKYYGVSYKNGFIAYTNSIQGIYSYETPSSEASYMAGLLDGIDSRLTSVEVSVQNDKVLVAASNILDISRSTDQTVLRYLLDGAVSTYTFASILTKVQLCGDNLLCTKEADSFRVYKLEDSTKKVLSSIRGVLDYTVLSNNTVFLVFSSKGIMFNPASQTGYAAFVSSGYSTGGVENTKDTVVMRIKSGMFSSAIQLTDKPSGGYDILSTISKLEASGLVDGISVYGKRVFITPRLGEVVFDETKGYFDYNETVKKAVNEKIDTFLSEEKGLDSGYIFINLSK